MPQFLLFVPKPLTVLMQFAMIIQNLFFETASLDLIEKIDIVRYLIILILYTE